MAGTAQEYLEAAMKMEDNDTLMIPCPTIKEAEVMRVRLYQLRKEARYKSLTIEKQTIDKKIYVVVRKVISIGGFILKSDGKVVPIEEEPLDTDSLARIVKLALQDGYALSDILKELSGTFTPEQIDAEYTKQVSEKEGD